MFCPSVVARQVAGAQWHAMMPAVHRAARELIDEGVLEGWHLGRPLYPGESLHGPLRLKLRGPALTARRWRIEVVEGAADGRGKSGRTEKKLR